MSVQPIIGVSSCLMGEAVRFNGGHKKDHWLTGKLANDVQLKSFCPEVGIGLTVPRPTLRLIATDSGVRAVDSNTQTNDVTNRLTHFYHQHKTQMDALDGYVVMQGSPSCGMERVKVYGSSSMPEKNGVGLFTAELMKEQPNLPIEEAGRLNDARIAESFLTRVFIYHEWRTANPGQSAKTLIEFHSKHKFLIMLHNYEAYRELGQLLSNLKTLKQSFEIAETYITLLMDALKTISAPKSRTNALLHLFGYLKTQLSSHEKHAILSLVEDYRQAKIPYIVPLTLLKHYAELYRLEAPYLWKQSVWAPYPQHLNQYKNAV